MTDEIEFFTALEEENQVIAQANAALRCQGQRRRAGRAHRTGSGEFSLISKNDVTLMDVSTKQMRIVSLPR